MIFFWQTGHSYTVHMLWLINRMALCNYNLLKKKEEKETYKHRN